MTIEIFYLTAQIHRWLDLRVARHLEAKAAKLRPTNGRLLTTRPMDFRQSGSDGPWTLSIGASRMGMSGCHGSADAAESFAEIHEPAAGTRYCAAQTAMRDCDKHAVRT